MKGNIQTTERCPVCQSALIHDENRDGFICKTDPRNHPLIIPRKCRVRFGRDVSRRFQSYREARQFLEGLRFKTVEGSFDTRDYQKDNPLAFVNQADRYIAMKLRIGSGSAHCRKNIQPVIKKAVRSWGKRNVKDIRYGDIEDFLYGLNVSNKTMSNTRSVLHDFFTWLSAREGIPVPRMPKIKFDLGWRNIIDIKTQRAVIDEVRRISERRTPRIWIAIDWLSTYVSIRPKELLTLTEERININGFLVIPPPDGKEREPKLVGMASEDIALYESMPRGLPHMHFFRHDLPHGQTKAGDKFGERYLYKWWKKACKNLGIEGVDLYGGTRHSTISSLADDFTEQQLMNAGTMHKTDVAFQRYYQAKKKDSIHIYTKIRENQRKAQVINFNEFKESTRRRKGSK